MIRRMRALCMVVLLMGATGVAPAAACNVDDELPGFEVSLSGDIRPLPWWMDDNPCFGPLPWIGQNTCAGKAVEY